MTRAVDIEGRGVRVNGRSVGVGSGIPDSAIARFKFEDNGDTNTFTESINGNDFSTNGSPNWSTDSKQGTYSVKLDRSNNETADGKSFSVNEVAVSTWIKYDSLDSSFTNSNQIINGSPNGQKWQLNVTPSGNLRSTVDTASGRHTVSGSSNLGSGTWYFVGMSYDTNELRLHLDGNTEATNSNLSGNIGSYSDGTIIGGRKSNSLTWDGHIDDLIVYDSVLTNAQFNDVLSIY